jgi:hypothetical protein
MLRTDLIDLINCGGVWAFVGSGLSSRAGLPSWPTLTETAADRLDAGAFDAQLATY